MGRDLVFHSLHFWCRPCFLC